MASLLILGFILATIILISAIITSISSKTHHQNLPPGSNGWPLIGETIAFGSNTEKFVHDRMTKYSSNVFKTSVAGQNVVILCGPEGNKFAFSNDDKLMKPWWPTALAKALLDTSPLFPENSFLKLDSIQQYVAVIDSATRDHIKKSWVPYDVVKAHYLAKYFTFSLACRIFINFKDEDQVNDLAKPFFTIFTGAVSLPLNLPGTNFYAATKAIEIVRNKLIAVIKQRRLEIREIKGKGFENSSDFLTNLLISEEDGGKLYKIEDIANKIIGYLFASYVTTSNAITYVLAHLAEYPHIYNQVFKEQMEIAKSKDAREPLTWADIKKMKYSWNVVCESMRLKAFSGMFKEALTDFTFSGFKIPKGWKVFWTMYTTNKDPKYFQDPQKFDPSRFEGDGPQPYTFVPFGGGPHMCRGKEYARIEILVFVHNVVTRFKLEKQNPNEKTINRPDPTPAEGLPLRLESHKL